MELFFLLFLAETIVCYTLFQLKLYLKVTYQHTEVKDEFSVKIMFFKSLVLYSMCIPAMPIEISPYTIVPWLEAQIPSDKVNPDTDHQPQMKTPRQREQKIIKKGNIRREVTLLFKWLHIYNNCMNRIISALHCEYLSWHTTCGMGDAATTALVTGLFWAIKGMIVKRVNSHSHLIVQPIISIKPQWDNANAQVTTAFQCIFTIRIGHVITAVWKAFFSKMHKEVMENV